MKTHLPVSEAEDTAAILCVEPLAFSFSATRLLLLLASTVNTSLRFFRKQWNSRGLQNPGSNASLQPTFYCRATLYRWLPQPPFLSSYLPSHSTSPHLFYNLTHTPSLLITVFSPCLSPCSALPIPFVLICQLTQRRGLLALLQPLQKDGSSFFESEAGPPTCSFQTAAAAAAALCADCSQRTDI